MRFVTHKAPAPKAKREPKVKNDPKLVAAARELRDRWLERVNATPLPSRAKYDVTSALPAPQAMPVAARLLPQAA